MISDNMWQGQHVRLTVLSKDDAATVSRWYQDAGFLRLVDANWARPRSADELEKRFEEWQKSEQGLTFAVRRLADDSLIALASLEDILWSHGVAWLGIGIGDREQWGKGYGLEAMELLLGYGFRELNLHRIQLTVFQYNERAIALYEKLGFQREGVYREFMQRDGKRYDMYLYGLLRREWEALYGKREERLD
jgi:RimJ/RimL family protein N-acetyltransferase